MVGATAVVARLVSAIVIPGVSVRRPARSAAIISLDKQPFCRYETFESLLDNMSELL